MCWRFEDLESWAECQDLAKTISCELTEIQGPKVSFKDIKIELSTGKAQRAGA